MNMHSALIADSVIGLDSTDLGSAKDDVYVQLSTKNRLTVHLRVLGALPSFSYSTGL